MAKVWKKLQRADSDFAGNVTGKVGGTDASDVKDGAVAGTAAKTITDAAFDSNTKLKTTNAADGLLNSQVTVAKDSSGNISLNNAGSGSISLDNSDVGLSNVTNHAQVKTDGSNAPDILKNDQITLTSSGGTVTLNNAGSGSIDKSDIGLSNVDNESKASILGGTFTGDIGGTSASDIKSGAALGATANQDSTSTILGGTLTGAVANTATVGGTAASTVASGAANGTTAIGAFDTSGSTPIIKIANAPSGLKNSEVDADHVGLGNVTNESKSTMFASPTFTGTVAGVTKGHVGLGSVVNQKVAVVSGKIQLDDVDQTIDADKVGGKTRAETEAAASSAAQTAIIGGAPGALNTLDELAAALGDDENFATSTTNALATKGKAPMTLTAEDVDGDSTFTNDPDNEVVGQIGVFGGQQYVVVDE